MKLSLSKVLSRKNLNLAVGLIALMVFLWLISYAIPNLFVQMFDTGLGNLILLGIVALASMANINLGVGLLIMFFILYRFAHMSGRRFEGFQTNAQLITNAKNGVADYETVNFMVTNGYKKYNIGQLNIMNKEQLDTVQKNLNNFLSQPNNSASDRATASSVLRAIQSLQSKRDTIDLLLNNQSNGFDWIKSSQYWNIITKDQLNRYIQSITSYMKTNPTVSQQDKTRYQGYINDVNAKIATMP